jgi:hypothetical protein
VTSFARMTYGKLSRGKKPVNYLDKKVSLR